ncbi:Aste57867_21321 [Aphanomyces stellatus]|uniref:Aste57867_21321 protein n=1 Tax=Aphanomyces stellatus TaxID=120398 RepID=A0A485LH94_9STRA|nr:hypothetical protein As57867_021252 [Aphanomyces stellatus]VFT97993.1 Aste57867_21321 [Aphanomyces stellatus]
MTATSPPTVVTLLPHEWYQGFNPPITSVTFYSVDDLKAPTSTGDSAFACAKAHLQARINATVQHNPWLTGRIQRNYFGPSTLEFDADAKSLPVDERTMPELSRNVPYETLTATLAHLPLPTVQGPMLRVYWISISASEAALVFSLLHEAADLVTYYRLYGMLNGATSIVSMSPNRFAGFPDASKLVVQDGMEQMGRVAALSFLCNAIRSLFFGAKPTVGLHTINPAFIAHEKARHQQTVSTNGPPFVTTNDILTSWFFSTTRCDVGLMMLNLRSRIQGLDATYAGNYSTSIPYLPADYATPSLIRQSVTSTYLRRALSGALPWLFTGSISLITSWVTLYEPATIPQWSMDEHLPFKRFERGLSFANYAVAFQRTKSSIGILLVTKTLDASGTEDLLLGGKT